MKPSPRYAIPWSLGLAVVVGVACIDVSTLKHPTGSGGAGGSIGQGGGGAAGLTGGGGSMGLGGGPGGGPVPGFSLRPNGDGIFVEGNSAGVRGGWWATGDAYGPDNSPGTGDCPKVFPIEDCSVLTTPTPGTPFRLGTNGMCTAGTAAQVLLGSDGQPAWSAIWGNIIGFTLASDFPTDAGVDSWGTYDAPAHGVRGLAFDIDHVPAPGIGNAAGHMRISFVTKGTELNPAFWMGAVSDRSPVTAPGHYKIYWGDVGGPSYLPSPPRFDSRTLEAIRFDVVSNDVEPVPYSFCLSNVAFLTN